MLHTSAHFAPVHRRGVERCLYVRYEHNRYPVPDPPFPFPIYHPREGTGSLSLSTISWALQVPIPYRLCGKEKVLAARCSVCYKAPTETRGGILQVLSFFVFIVTVVVGTSAIGYGLSLLEEPAASRRCRVPHEALRRGRVHRQRGRCRLEG